MKKNLVIYGTGKFAEYAAYLFEQKSDYSLIGFCIEKKFSAKSQLPEHYKHLKLWEFEFLPQEKKISLFIAVGNNEIRTRIFNKGLNLGYKFASFISPEAITYDNLEIGQNVFISEGSILHPFVTIENNTILIGSRIGHHSKISANCLLSSCTVAGNSVIGKSCYLGVNSSVSQNTHIASKNILGMNVSIEKDTSPGSVFTHTGTKKRDMDFEKVSNRFLK